MFVLNLSEKELLMVTDAIAVMRNVGLQLSIESVHDGYKSLQENIANQVYKQIN